MPLQRLTMNSDYSERLIRPLPPKSNRNPPRAILISSTRASKSASSFPAFSNSSLLPPARTANLRRPKMIEEIFQQRMRSYGPYNPGLNLQSKTRKFADFSADEDVTMARRTPSYLTSLFPKHNTMPTNIYVNDLNFLLPPRLISQPAASQPTTTPNHEDDGTSPNLGNPAPQNPEDDSSSSNFQSPAALSTSLQLPHGPEINAPVTNWRQAVVGSCVVGVALVAVATGYACATVFRGALNVGQFIYTNRDNIQQTCTICTQAVQSTYNAAKRRMVSIPIPRVPVGMRRHYPSTPSSAQGRSWRRRFSRQSRVPAQPTAQQSQAINPVVSILAPEGMSGVEYCGLSGIGQFPDTHDAVDPDAFILPHSPDALASGVPYMTGGLFHTPTSPPHSPVTVQDQPASENLNGALTPDAMELTDQPCIYEESVFSEDIEDEYVVEDRNNKVPTAELFRDEGHMELEQDWWSFPGQFEPKSPSEASSSLTAPHAGPMGVSPVFETTPPTIEAAAPVIEHASPSTSPSPSPEPGSPFPSPPGSFPPPPAPPPTPSPKAATHSVPMQAKSRKGARAPKKAMPKGKNPPSPPPCKRKASSPPKDVRRSNRIANLKK